jgi:hypothetical protein
LLENTYLCNRNLDLNDIKQLLILKKTIMKTRLIQWMMAAILICGSTVFSACSYSEDNPGPEPAKRNRTEFIKHTRANLKELAENLNFRSWEAANSLNQHFNQYVLNNPEFEKAVLSTFMLKAVESIQPVEEGSKLAEMGYTMYGTVDFTEFNYRFVMNDERTGFDVEPADDFELILNGWNPRTQQVENGLYKLTFKAGGSTSFKFIRPLSQQSDFAIVINVPSEFQFAISDMISGTWRDGFSGIFHNQVTVAEGHEYAKMIRDSWAVSGTVCSSIPGGGMNKADETTLNFSYVSDRVNSKIDAAISWEQNGRKMFDLTVKESSDGMGDIFNLDLSQFSSSASIFDVIAFLMTGRSLEEAKLTLLDDLTTTISISDMAKVTRLGQELAHARRNYADQQTIDQYTQQMNQFFSGSMSCADINQQIPMRLQTIKFGIDYWSVPALNFADENGYVPITDMLDKESIEYMINIMDHSVEPMQQSLIIMRQLMQYIQTLLGGMQAQ